MRLHSACGDALKSSRRLPHGARLRRHAAAAPAPHVCAVNDVVPGHVYDGELVFRVGKLRFWLRARVAASAAEVAAGSAAPWASGVWSPRDGLCISRFTALCIARQLHPVQPNANAAREELAVIQALLWGYAPVIPGFAPEGCAAGVIQRGWPLTRLCAGLLARNAGVVLALAAHIRGAPRSKPCTCLCKRERIRVACSCICPTTAQLAVLVPPALPKARLQVLAAPSHAFACCTARDRVPTSAGGNRRAVCARLERGLTLEDIEAYIERRKQIATDAALMGHSGVEFSDVAAGGARAGATCPKPATPVAADGAAFARRDAVRILVKLAPDAVQGLDMLVSGDMYTRDFVIDMGGTTAAAPVGAQSNDGAAKAYECLWQASLNSSSTESLRSAYVSGLAAAKALAANIDAALQVTSADIGDPGALIAAANEAVATMLGTPRSALAGAGNTAAEIRQLLAMNIGIDAAMTEAESAAAWQSQPALLWQVQALADFAEAFKAIETALEHGKASLTRRVETVLMSRTTLAARSALLKSVQHARGRAKENLREAIDAADARNATTSPGEKAAKAAGEGFGPGAPRAATAAAAATHPRAVSDTEGAADATEHPTDPDLLPSTSWRVPVIDAAPSPGLSDSAASDGTPPAPATPAATPAAARAAPPRWADPKLQRAIQREVRRALHPRACEEAPLWPRRLAFAFGGAYNVFVRFRLPRATLDGLRENVWDAEALTAAREAAGAAPASFWTPDPEFIFELTLARGFATAPSVLCHTEVGAFVVGEEICMGAYSSYHVDNAYTFDLPRQVGALVQLAAGVLSGDDELAGSVGVVWEYDAHAFALLASASAGSNAAFSERRGLQWAEARGG